MQRALRTEVKRAFLQDTNRSLLGGSETIVCIQARAQGLRAVIPHKWYLWDGSTGVLVDAKI